MFKRDQANGTVRKKSDNNLAIVNADSDLIVVGSGDLCYVAADNDWIIDSGASFHVTPHKSFFCSYKEGQFGEAKMGNRGVSKITAIGDVMVRTELGYVVTLKNVRHIPDFRMNVISSGALDNSGYVNTFGKGQWRLTKDDRLIAVGLKQGTLYHSKLEPLGNDIQVVNCQGEHQGGKTGNVEVVEEENHRAQGQGETVQCKVQTTRTSTRNRKASSRYSPDEYVLLTEVDESVYCQETVGKGGWLQSNVLETKQFTDGKMYSSDIEARMFTEALQIQKHETCCVISELCTSSGSSR